MNWVDTANLVIALLFVAIGVVAVVAHYAMSPASYLVLTVLYLVATLESIHRKRK